MSHGGKRDNSGGKRSGSGRKPKVITQAKKSLAGDILNSIGEVKTWKWIIATARGAKDARTVLDALKYLTDRRDGRPAQQIVGDPNRPLAVELRWPGAEPPEWLKR